LLSNGLIAAVAVCPRSTLLDELWYLTRHGQLIASWTHVPIPPIGSDGASDGAADGSTRRRSQSTP